MAFTGLVTIHIGISTKLYLSYSQSLDWLGRVTELAREHPGVVDGRVALFVAPSTPLLESAVRLAAGTRVRVAAQDVSRYAEGAHTGETGAPLLAGLGVTMAEVGHAERRADGETDAVVAAKVAVAQEAGLTPLLCVGETTRCDPREAAAWCLEQVRAATTGPLMIAYEPVWAIGAAEPAPASHVTATVDALRDGLPGALAGTPIVYGGSAGPGLLGRLHPSVDGLFLGRFAHDPENVRRVLDEAAALTA
ncbi:triosephosphate isomerase [Curtobacterium sp. MCBD17_034]|nr:triosephosphate isomerase [Curtobacterium sp. MCBD17_034]PZM40090.1 triosephosphate isomerase [Curtobacterium sp. MCBD17_031]